MPALLSKDSPARARYPYLCTKKYFSSVLESDWRLNLRRRKYLILLGKNNACGLSILLKPAPLKAFSAVKWRLFTTLSTVDVDICKKRFKYGDLSAFSQELGQTCRRCRQRVQLQQRGGKRK
ncbi:hypothetical protein [Duganella vulcania]|uniref:Uncharacterized protein n=1 Tax=Duganella vulcania TaxID=2692166 RepID=A0A845GKW9_9BURK|nr:hypothetical protein [Duganella vulcania]MYM94006.1 hypothetical protein [Duganella vulcania]